MGNEERLIDQGAPRTNQALVATVVVAAFLADLPWLLPVLTALLWTGVALGRAWIPAYHLYFRVIRPLTGEVWIEDERAPRFAQALGGSGLLVGFLCIRAGFATFGWGLVLTLAAMALGSVVTGFCFGCKTYWLVQKIRGVKAFRPDRIDPDDVSLPAVAPGETAIVQFGHPLCHDCHLWEKRLAAEPRPSVRIDVSERPDLARRYGVGLLPTIFEVSGDGSVVRQMAP